MRARQCAPTGRVQITTEAMCKYTIFLYIYGGEFLHFAGFFHGKGECGPITVTGSALEALGAGSFAEVWAGFADGDSLLGDLFFVFVEEG